MKRGFKFAFAKVQIVCCVGFGRRDCLRWRLGAVAVKIGGGWFTQVFSELDPAWIGVRESCFLVLVGPVECVMKKCSTKHLTPAIFRLV
ncbi:MAG: hypothetical protein HW380_73 [Magnetococcales bacterium]|nr:hypothetical protein [Magnetococcales bacterium]